MQKMTTGLQTLSFMLHPAVNSMFRLVFFPPRRTQLESTNIKNLTNIFFFFTEDETLTKREEGPERALILYWDTKKQGTYPINSAPLQGTSGVSHLFRGETTDGATGIQSDKQTKPSVCRAKKNKSHYFLFT